MLDDAHNASGQCQQEQGLQIHWCIQTKIFTKLPSKRDNKTYDFCQTMSGYTSHQQREALIAPTDFVAFYSPCDPDSQPQGGRT